MTFLFISLEISTVGKIKTQFAKMLSKKLAKFLTLILFENNEYVNCNYSFSVKSAVIWQKCKSEIMHFKIGKNSDAHN